MSVEAHEISLKGPQEVMQRLAAEERQRGLEDIEIKLLADICWTRANTLDQADPKGAKEWVRAALAGYEFLDRHAKPALAESARENADMLREWALTAN